MLTFLGATVTLCGFIYCHNNPFLKYKLKRYSGHYFITHLIWSGLKPSIPAIIILSVFGYFKCYQIFCSFIEKLLKNAILQIDIKEYEISICILSLLMILFSWLGPFIHYKIIRKISDEQGFEESCNDNSLDRKICQSLYSSYKYLIITLNNNKVYIGKVTSFDPSNVGVEQHIVIVPMLSGYRNSDDHTIEFTTHYHNINDLKNKTLEVIINKNDIFILQNFEQDVYNKVNHINEIVL